MLEWSNGCKDKKEKQEETLMIAVSGVKNSGKTTLITRLLPILTGFGLKVATIKHDGHDFEPDVPGTDSFRHRQAGACASAVISGRLCMMVMDRDGVTPEKIAGFFPAADLILLEGFKDSRYPKLEVIRSGNSDSSVCEQEHLLAVVTDLKTGIEDLPERVPILDLNDPEGVAAFLIAYAGRAGRCYVERPF